MLLSSTRVWVGQLQAGRIALHNTSISCGAALPAPPCVVRAVGSGGALLAALRDTAAAAPPAPPTTLLLTANTSLQGLGLPRLVPRAAAINLTSHVTIMGGEVSAAAVSSVASIQTRVAMANITAMLAPSLRLDWGGLMGLVYAASPAARLTLSGLVLSNLPPGAPHTYPLGLVTALGWLVDAGYAPSRCDV
jgi:hypothetical protein